MTLSDTTIVDLELLADALQSSVLFDDLDEESAAKTARFIAEVRALLVTPTTEALGAYPEVQFSLGQAYEMDIEEMPDDTYFGLRRDLALSGYFRIPNPMAYYTRRQFPIILDGVRYDIW